MEDRIKELFSNEEYVKGLVELGSYEAATAKLAEDGVEVSEDELKKLVELLKKKNVGELKDEDLEGVAGGSLAALAVTGAFLGTIGAGVGIVTFLDKHC